jgi:hypothetical protein
VEIVLPSIEFATRSLTFAERPQRLAGATVGLLDGWGDAADPKAPYPSMREIAALLTSRHDVARVVWRKKANVSQQVTDDELGDFLADVDVVVNGEGL